MRMFVEVVEEFVSFTNFGKCVQLLWCIEQLLSMLNQPVVYGFFVHFKH